MQIVEMNKPKSLISAKLSVKNIGAKIFNIKYKVSKSMWKGKRGRALAAN